MCCNFLHEHQGGRAGGANHTNHSDFLVAQVPSLMDTNFLQVVSIIQLLNEALIHVLLITTHLHINKFIF